MATKTKGSKAKVYLGTLAAGGVLAGSTYEATPLANLLNVTPPKKTRAKIDETNMESEDDYTEQGAGDKSADDAEFTLQMDATQNETLHTKFEADEKIAIKIVYKSGDTWEAKGFFSEIGDEEVDRTKLITTNVKFAISGKPIFKKAAAA